MAGTGQVAEQRGAEPRAETEGVAGLKAMEKEGLLFLNRLVSGSSSLAWSRHADGGLPLCTSWPLDFTMTARHAEGDPLVGNGQVPVCGHHPCWHADGGQHNLLFHFLL